MSLDSNAERDQTMRIVRDTDGHGYTVYDEMDVGGVVHKSEFWVRADRLHLLASAAQAALAEQKQTAETAGDWQFERCSGYAGYRCRKCLVWVYHDQAQECSCHQPQAQRREA